MKCPKPKRLIIERDDIAKELIDAGWTKVPVKAFRRLSGAQELGGQHGNGAKNIALLPCHPLSGEAFDPRDREWRSGGYDATKPKTKFAKGHGYIHVPGYADLDPRWDRLNAGAEGQWLIFRPENHGQHDSRTITDAFVLFENDADAVLFTFLDKEWTNDQNL